MIFRLVVFDPISIVSILKSHQCVVGASVAQTYNIYSTPTFDQCDILSPSLCTSAIRELLLVNRMTITTTGQSNSKLPCGSKKGLPFIRE